MDKRKRNKKKDISVIAFDIVQHAIKETPPNDPTKEHSGKNPHAVALGRLGGLKGGPARAEKLSAKKRKAIAQKAAKARWSK